MTRAAGAITTAVVPFTMKLRKKLVAALIAGTLALVAFALATSAPASASEKTEEQGHVQDRSGRWWPRPVSHTFKFNKAETRRIANRASVTAILGGFAGPAAPYISGSAGLIAGWAADAVSEGKCVAVKVKNFPSPKVVPSKYRC